MNARNRAIIIDRHFGLPVRVLENGTLAGIGPLDRADSWPGFAEAQIALRTHRLTGGSDTNLEICLVRWGESP